MIDAIEQLESALNAPEDEKQYFIRQALQLLEDEPHEPSKTELNIQVSNAGPQETVIVPIEFTAAILELIDLEREDDQSVPDYIRNSVAYRLNMADHDQWMNYTVETEVELPPEAAQRGRLWHNHYRALGSESCLDDVLFNYLSIEHTWLVDGEPIEEPDDTENDC